MPMSILSEKSDIFSVLLSDTISASYAGNIAIEENNMSSRGASPEEQSISELIAELKNAGTPEDQGKSLFETLRVLGSSDEATRSIAIQTLEAWLATCESTAPVQIALLTAVDTMEGHVEAIRFLVEHGADPYSQVAGVAAPVNPIDAFLSEEGEFGDAHEGGARSPVEALIALAANPAGSFFSNETLVATAGALLGDGPVTAASQLPERVNMHAILTEGDEAGSIAAQWRIDLLCAVDMMDAVALRTWLHGRLAGPAIDELRMREGDRALELLGARAAPSGGLTFGEPEMKIHHDMVEERLAMQLLANGAELRCQEQGWRDIASRATGIGAPVIIQAAKGIGTYSYTNDTECRLVERMLQRGAIGLNALHDGQTVLMAASIAGNSDLVARLIAAGADPRVRSGVDSEMPGLTALEILRADRNPPPGDSIVQLLNAASSKLTLSEIMEKSRAQPGLP